MRQWLERGRALWGLGSAALLGFFWLIALLVCWDKMAPRLAYLAGRPIANDSPCPTPECDFSVFWPAGIMARSHLAAQIYDSRIFQGWGQGYFFPGAAHYTFYYPPTVLLPSAAISLLPFELGFFVWTGLGLGLAAWALRQAKISWPVILAGLLSPAALWDYELGQLGVLGGAILLAGLMALRAAPGRGGLLLALLSLKPQIGLLVPAAFLGARSVRGFGLFLAGCAALVLASLAAFGWPAWYAYFTAGRAATAAVLNAPVVPGLASGAGLSVFWMLRSLGAGLPAAYAVQGVVTLLAMCAAAYVWSRRELKLLDAVALTVFLSLLAVPYGYCDDMVACSVVLAALAERRGWRIGLIDALVWLWPVLCPVVTAKTGVLLTPLVVALALARGLAEAGLFCRKAVPVLPGAREVG